MLHHYLLITLINEILICFYLNNRQVFDLQSGCMADQIRVALDTVNGVSCHPYLNLLAVSTGEINKALLLLGVGII